MAQEGKGKSPYQRHQKSPFKYHESIGLIDEARKAGDGHRERAAIERFNEHIRRTHGWTPGARRPYA